MSLFPDSKYGRKADPAIQVYGFYQLWVIKKSIDTPNSMQDHLKTIIQIYKKQSEDAEEAAWETFRNVHKALEEKFKKS